MSKIPSNDANILAETETLIMQTFYLNFSMVLSSEISRLVLYYLLSFPLPLSYLLSFSLSKKNYFFAFLLINVYYYYLICLSVLNYTVLIFVKHF